MFLRIIVRSKWLRIKRKILLLKNMDLAQRDCGWRIKDFEVNFMPHNEIRFIVAMVRVVL